MSKFEKLAERIKEDSEKRIAEKTFYIENGYFPTWAEEHRNNADAGLKAYSTETRWNQYKTGMISREKAVELASKRAVKGVEKDSAAKVGKLEKVAAAPGLEYIAVSVEWVRSKTWGYNPRVEVRTNTGIYTGMASGCGYDKESAAIADAFNKCNSILKALYSLKESGLQAGKSDASEMACTGVNNTDICGHGAGYSVLPYFKGGVGSTCFWSILEKCGFIVSAHHGKHSDFYRIEKEA